MPIRFRVREELERAGMSYRKAAALSGVSLSTITRMAANTTGTGILDTLEKLARVLDCAPGDLIESDKPTKRRRK